MFAKRRSTTATTSPAPGVGTGPARTQAPAQPPPPKEAPPPPGGGQPQPSASSKRTRNKASKEKVEQFNVLKMRLHRKLIDKLDLTRMVGDEESLREQVKDVVAQLADQEQTLLNFAERQRLINEVLDETFGLGPLEVILTDPLVSDILVNGPKQVYVERGGNPRTHGGRIP